MPKSAAQPGERLADGTHGCGHLMKGLSEAPASSPLCGARLLSEQGASRLSPRVTRARSGFGAGRSGSELGPRSHAHWSQRICSRGYTSFIC